MSLKKFGLILYFLQKIFIYYQVKHSGTVQNSFAIEKWSNRNAFPPFHGLLCTQRENTLRDSLQKFITLHKAREVYL